MGYSVKPILMQYKDSKGLQGVSIQIICGKLKAYKATGVKVPEGNFKLDKVVWHKEKVRLNAIIKTACNNIEGRILELMRKDIPITEKVLKKIASGETIDTASGLLTDFITDLMQELSGKLSEGRLKHYKVIRDKIKDFDERARLAEIDYKWIVSFERFLMDGGIVRNTLKGNMALLKAIINHALKKDLINIDPFKKYVQPKSERTMPDYLTKDEIEAFAKVVEGLGHKEMKNAGYYFLFSCHLGYRIGDCLSFDNTKRVADGQVTLQAKKNGKIVSIPIYSRLKPILDYVSINPITESEQKVREHIKEIAKLAGINKNVKFHTARHSFAMMMMSEGFTVDEVAEMLGDTVQTARIYAKISNVDLSKKIMERLK